MSRNIADINHKLAYLTHPRTGPKLKVLHPLVLKDKIDKVFRQGEVKNACTDQYNGLFKCLSENDYMDSKCAKQLSSLLTCEKKQQAELATKEETKNKDQRLSRFADKKAKNRLLKMYPTSAINKAMVIQRNNYITLSSHKKQPVPYIDSGRPFNQR